jgi:hypothetical protein
MVAPELVVGGLIGGLAEPAHVIDDSDAVVSADDSGTGVLCGAGECGIGGRALLDAVFLGGEVVDVEEVDVGGVGLLVEAGAAGVIHGEVHAEVIVCVGVAVRCVKMKKERMKRVRAKRAAMMVQQQSVHFRSFSSTGKLRNVKTLFLNMINKNLFPLLLFETLEAFQTLPFITTSRSRKE